MVGDELRWSVRLTAWAERWRWVIFAVLAAVLLGVWNGEWRLGPDAARTAWVARQSLETGQGWHDAMGWHETLSPGVLGLYTWSMWVGGEAWAGVVQAVVWLSAVGALILTYLVFLRVVARGEAVLVTALTGLTWTFLAGAVRPLGDMAFLCGVMLVWLGVEVVRGSKRAATPGDPGRAGATPRWRAVMWGVMLIGEGLALAAVTRSVWVVLAGGVALGLIVELTRARRWGWLAGLLTGWLAVTAGLRSVLLGGAWGVSDDERALMVSLGRWSEKLGPNVRQLLEESASEGLFATDLGFVAWGVSLAVLAYGVVVPWRRRPMWSCFVGLLIVQWLAFLPTDRYLLAALPMLVWAWWRAAVVVEGWVVGWGERRGWGGVGVRAGGLVVAGAALMLVVSNGVQVGGLMVDQRRPDLRARLNSGRYEAMRGLASILRARLPEGAIVFAGRSHPHDELAFYANVRVLDDLPAEPPPASAYFVIEPYDEHLSEAMAAFGWVAGDALGTVARADGREQWTLRWLNRWPGQSPRTPRASRRDEEVESESGSTEP